MRRQIIYFTFLLIFIISCQDKDNKTVTTRDSMQTREQKQEQLPDQTKTKEETRQVKPLKIEIKSTAFKDSGMIPVKYTCKGDNISPPISISTNAPDVKSFAIICEDPDAPSGLVVHWVIYNIPVDATELKENIPSLKILDNGATQGINTSKKNGYMGPCPPSGTHRYFFKLYALDATFNINDATRDELLTAMKGHILAETQLMGKYRKE